MQNTNDILVFVTWVISCMLPCFKLTVVFFKAWGAGRLPTQLIYA